MKLSYLLSIIILTSCLSSITLADEFDSPASDSTNPSATAGDTSDTDDPLNQPLDSSSQQDQTKQTDTNDPYHIGSDTSNSNQNDSDGSASADNDSDAATPEDADPLN